MLFAVIPPAEECRLFELLGGIKTLDDAIRAFGSPDDDSPNGVTVKQPEQEGVVPTTQSFRTLKYSHLSQTADVVITDCLSKGVRFSLAGKYLG